MYIYVHSIPAENSKSKKIVKFPFVPKVRIHVCVYIHAPTHQSRNKQKESKTKIGTHTHIWKKSSSARYIQRTNWNLDRNLILVYEFIKKEIYRKINEKGKREIDPYLIYNEQRPYPFSHVVFHCSSTFQ